MTQEQFNTIVRVLRGGAPALADELIQALQALIVNSQMQAKELEELKANQAKTETPAVPKTEVPKTGDK